MIEEFRKSLNVNADLFLRSTIENIALRAINLKLGAKEDLMAPVYAYHYATIMTPEQILRYRTLGSSEQIHDPRNLLEMFETYLRKENLPEIDEVLKNVVDYL